MGNGSLCDRQQAVRSEIPGDSPAEAGGKHNDVVPRTERHGMQLDVSLFVAKHSLFTVIFLSFNGS